MKKNKVSVPGSIMLLGEHAVLRGYLGVSCAVDQQIHASLLPRKDNKIIIDSDRIGKLTFDLNHIPKNHAFRFVLKAISCYLLSHGFQLTIKSEFSDQVGLGSSAAVTVATISVLEKMTVGKVHCAVRETDGQHNVLHPRALSLRQRIFEKSLRVIRDVQGLGSGADVAASVYGGVISYQIKKDRINIKKIEVKPPIQLIYTGYKTPTVEVVNQVNAAEKKEPKKYKLLFEEIEKLTLKGVDALETEDWKKLGKIFNQHQALQQSLGVSDETIDGMIKKLKQDPSVLGAKISGSGLGDCVVVLKTRNAARI